MMNKSTSLLYLLLVITSCLLVQNQIISQQMNTDGNEYHYELSKQFRNYKVVTIDEQELLSELSDFSGVKRVTLKIDNEESWDLEILPQNKLVESMKVVTALDGDITNQINVFPYRGIISNYNSANACLTVAKNFIYGYYQDDNYNRFLEPLHHLIPGAPLKMYVVYDGDDVVFPEGDFCASSHMINQTNEVIDNPQEMIMTGGCFEVEYATASDFSMFNKYGGSSGLTAHNIGVMNNVQNNYDDEFDDEILFSNVEQWISNCNTCDPWTTSNNASTFLGSFRTWGIGGGFSTPVSGFDFAQIWTNRNFSGSTIGIAYVGVVCTGSKYQALQDFSGNANLKRVMVAHETGHNFNAVQSTTGHDPSGSAFIMAPSVSNVSAWSTQSISDIEAHYNSRWCLLSCAVSTPPIAEFTSDIDTGCVSLLVVFQDLSTNSPTSWDWTFPGGIPTTSTLQNPLVTYLDGGSYDVTLTVENSSGSNSITKTAYINTQAAPFTFFTSSINANTVLFSNNSQNGNFYIWNFGDGESSSEENPVHIYSEDGSYSVTLTAGNDCGSTSTTSVIQIATVPVAWFGQSTIEGCASLEVEFYNESSSNADEFLWTFDGGEPSTSTEENPVVIYPSEGIYNVTLLVSNEIGENVRSIDSLISINDIPSPTFTISKDSTTVMFTNNTMNSDSSSWDFGDGNSSTIENPTHTYSSDGDYIVSLTSTNICGDSTLSQLITIITLPIAEGSANTTDGCVGFVVQFADSSSSNVDTLLWTFEGGSPISSTEQNPMIQYDNVGVFDVSLIVMNSEGGDTLLLEDYITVGTTPTANIENTITDNSVSFISNAIDADSYLWTVQESSDTFDVSDPIVTFPSDGIYIANLDITNTCGTSTYTTEVEITAFPDANFDSDVVSGCSPLIVQFTDDSQDSVSSWSWEFSGGTPSESTSENPIIQYDSTGDYQVKLTVSNNIGDNVIVKENYIIVYNTPIANFDFSINDSFVQFTNTSDGGNNSLWDFGDGESSNEENPLHQFTENGTYQVILIKSNNECADTTSQTITIIIDNVVNQDESKFSIYPIPSHDFFFVEFDSEISGDVTYELIDALGTKVKEGNMNVRKGNETHRFVIEFPTGLYFLKLKISNQEFLQKLIIE